MRESVLLALIHIFAIVSTVNPVGITSRGKKILRSYLRRYLNRELEEEYYALFENNLEFYSRELKNLDSTELADENSLISFQITNTCRQIKKGLFLEERMNVFLQLLEFAFEDGDINYQEKIIVDIVAKTFNIPKKEYDNAYTFMMGRSLDEMSSDAVLIIEGEEKDGDYNISGELKNYDLWRHLTIKGLEGYIVVLYFESTGALLFTYDGPLTLYFKGRDIIAFRPYLLERGVNIKGQGIEPIYYSKIFKQFVLNKITDKVVFEGHNLEYHFKNSKNGVQDYNFKVESGNMVAIMGGSGVGKTTMLNLLHGKIKPTKGVIYINGHDIHSEGGDIKGLIGYVPQDDMLIEELTVYQNLYFNARLCFGNYTEEQLKESVDRVLNDLDLYEIKDLQVGDLLNKKVSGGQRKRLNIGLELMREPRVLFVDEPTSGLSSFDSQNVMNLLKKQALNGKLVFAIIHQPSSDILKMFDRLWLLDKGGYMIYDGDPVEALVYFKTETSQANAAESECPNCGNIETDQLLQIIEVKVIDNNGMPNKERQVSPEEWYGRYRKKMMPILREPPPLMEVTKGNFNVPSRKNQVRTFIKRNLTRKFSDKQYMTINLLEAPLLALILGYISMYYENGVYLFSANKNYPVFLFMSVVVAMFIGLTVSAEEIFRDRKILEREKFLNLSRFSYLTSKLNYLFMISAIQTLSFVLVANLLLGVRGTILLHWVILFTTACCGNLIGLNISAGMKSAVSIYILIPFILVPQLLLGGAMIKFDDLHRSVSKMEYVPIVGDMMPIRWSYEALSVGQFRDNKYEKPFFEYEMEASQNDWYASFLIPTLEVYVDECLFVGKQPEYSDNVNSNLAKLNYHIPELASLSAIQTGNWFENLNYESFDSLTAKLTKEYLGTLKSYFRQEEKRYTAQREYVYNDLVASMGNEKLVELKEKNYNEQLASIVLNRLSVTRIYEAEDKLIQKASPIFMAPTSKNGRSHFFAPYKRLAFLKIDTVWFNLTVLWLMTLFLFVVLYYNLLFSLVKYIEKYQARFIKKFRYRSHLSVY
jgi:ABC-type multidrug transport system ATPase subunit